MVSPGRPAGKFGSTLSGAYGRSTALPFPERAKPVAGDQGQSRERGGTGGLGSWHRGMQAIPCAFLPLRVTTKSQEHISSYFEPFGAGSPLAGVSPAEVHNRAPRALPLVSGGARSVGNGVLAAAEGGKVAFCQFTPQGVNPALGTPTAFSAVKDESGRPGALMTLGPITPQVDFPHI